MPADKIVALIHIFDQVDLLKNFFAWYTEIGVDHFIVQDMGSTDGSLELLEDLARRYPIEWFSLKEKDLRKHRFGNTGDEMVMLGREKLDPKWLLMCDVDEFLVLENEALPQALERAETRGLTSITIPCFNMTGAPLSEGADAVADLSLRIVSPYRETYEEQVSGILPKPYVFIRHPPKSIVMAAAFSGYVAGSHGAHVGFGRTGAIEGAHFNHYSIRGYDKFHQKIRNTEAFLTANNHLESWWAWHWRRWIELEHAGRLKEDFDQQFVSEDQQNELIETGICVLDCRVADWAKNARKIAAPLHQQTTPSDVPQIEGQVSLRDWYLCDNAFKATGQIEQHRWSEFSPFINWLVEAIRPRTVLDIGTPCETASLSFCDAFDLNALDGRCISVQYRPDTNQEAVQTITVREAQLQHQFLRHCHHLMVLDGGIDAALANIAAGSIDILSIDGFCHDRFNEETLSKIFGILSDCGVILLRGINLGSQEKGIRGFWNQISKGRPQFELFHGDGLGILGIGTGFPDALSKLCALSTQDARTFRNIYAQLGRAVPKMDEHAPLIADLNSQIATLQQERAAFEGGCAERDTIIRNTIQEREAFRSGCAERDAIIQGLSNERERLENAWQAQDAAIKNLVFELERYKSVTIGPLKAGWERRTHRR